MQVWCDWQVALCDPHLSALEVRFSLRCAIQIDVYPPSYLQCYWGERLKVKISDIWLTAIRYGFELYECLLVCNVCRYVVITVTGLRAWNSCRSKADAPRNHNQQNLLRVTRTCTLSLPIHILSQILVRLLYNSFVSNKNWTPRMWHKRRLFNFILNFIHHHRVLRKISHRYGMV